MARSWDLVAPALTAGLGVGGWTPDDSRAESAAGLRPPRAMKSADPAGDAALVGAARAAAFRDSG